MQDSVRERPGPASVVLWPDLVAVHSHDLMVVIELHFLLRVSVEEARSQAPPQL